MKMALLLITSTLNPGITSQVLTMDQCHYVQQQILEQHDAFINEIGRMEHAEKFSDAMKEGISFYSEYAPPATNYHYECIPLQPDEVKERGKLNQCFLLNLQRPQR